MSVLEVSQIIFNFVISIAVIITATLIGVIFYEVIKFIESAKKLVKDISEESAEIHEKINKFLESIFRVTFFSKLFKKKSKK